MINQELKEKVLKNRPFYVKNAIHNLFSWQELEKVLNLTPFVNDDRFRIISNKQYNWKSSAWQTDVNAYPIELIKEEIKHYNSYIKDASRVNFAVNHLASELEKITGFPVDAHIYFALRVANNQGFGIHTDSSHNFIVQIEGETNFKVWDIVGDDENVNIDYIKNPPYLDVVLKPGDVIYIPKRHWHEAISLTKRMSISFPISPIENSIMPNREWLNIDDYLLD